MQAQALPHTLGAVAVAEANLEAVVDESAVQLEGVDMDVDAEDDTSPIHQDAPIAIWTTTPPKNVEKH